jgi:heme oxygenase
MASDDGSFGEHSFLGSLRLSARLTLRSATRPDHDAVDAAFSRYDLSTLAGYGQFLTAQARVFGAVEASVEAGGVRLLIKDWPLRCRADRLSTDLEQLGIRPGPSVPVPSFSDAAGILGAVYVLEGSRLGGTLLSRALPAGAPARFLSSEDNGPPWLALVELINRRLTSAPELDTAVAAARSVFQAFLAAAQVRTAA